MNTINLPNPQWNQIAQQQQQLGHSSSNIAIDGTTYQTISGSGYNTVHYQQKITELETALDEAVEGNLALSLTSSNPLVRQTAEKISKMKKYREAIEEAKKILPPEIVETLGLK